VVLIFYDEHLILVLSKKFRMDLIPISPKNGTSNLVSA